MNDLDNSNSAETIEFTSTLISVLNGAAVIGVLGLAVYGVASLFDSISDSDPE